MGTQEEEEAMDCSTTNKDANGAFDYEFTAVAVAVAVTKGKRTKRRRIHPPPPPVPTTAVGPDSSSSSDSSAAAAAAAADEEDEDELDMANCLILLAQGHRAEPDLGPTRCDVYKCRTCDKRFPSFQALGGHRASHKKPKPSPPPATDDDVQRTSVDSSSSKPATAASANNNNNNSNNSRVHECAICGSEFNSGQALGGHMRKHRPLGVVPAAAGPAAPPAEEAKNKKRILLSLDLNLPAPADDDCADGSKELVQRLPPFGLSNNPPPMIFSASLVGCHY